MRSVSESSAHEGKRDTRRAGGVFDDGAARREPTLCGGALDHGPGHAIFHASGGIRRLQFGYHSRASGGHEVAEFDQGSVPDGIENPRARHGSVPSELARGPARDGR